MSGDLDVSDTQISHTITLQPRSNHMGTHNPSTSCTQVPRPGMRCLISHLMLAGDQKGNHVQQNASSSACRYMVNLMSNVCMTRTRQTAHRSQGSTFMTVVPTNTPPGRSTLAISLICAQNRARARGHALLRKPRAGHGLARRSNRRTQHSTSGHPPVTRRSLMHDQHALQDTQLQNPAASSRLEANAHSDCWVGPAVDRSSRMDGSQRRGRKGQPRDVSAQQQHSSA